MAVPEDYDLGVDLPATIKTTNGVFRIVGCAAGEEKEVIFIKFTTEEEWKEELGIEEDE